MYFGVAELRAGGGAGPLVEGAAGGADVAHDVAQRQVVEDVLPYFRRQPSPRLVHGRAVVCKGKTKKRKGERKRKKEREERKTSIK